MFPMIPLSSEIVNIQNELNLIGVNAKGLKGPGRDLLPLKPEMLWLPPVETDLVMQTVELLFAAILRYVDAQLREKQCRTAVDVVAARLDRGRADGTVIALCHGPTRRMIEIATERAPLVMHAIFQAAPELRIAERLMGRMFRRAVPTKAKTKAE